MLRKNKNGFLRNRPATSQILTIRRILEGALAKNLEVTILFVDFSKAFDSIHRGKMLYKNTKVKVHSPEGDTDYFEIVAGVLQGHISLIPVYHLPRLRA